MSRSLGIGICSLRSLSFSQRCFPLTISRARSPCSHPAAVPTSNSYQASNPSSQKPLPPDSFSRRPRAMSHWTRQVLLLESTIATRAHSALRGMPSPVSLHEQVEQRGGSGCAPQRKQYVVTQRRKHGSWEAKLRAVHYTRILSPAFCSRSHWDNLSYMISTTALT